jgi:hypothetical protein
MSCRQKAFRTFKSESGNSLISVIIASAISLIIILTIATTFSNMNSSMAFFRNRVDSIEEQNHIMQILSDNSRCFDALKDVKLDLTGVTSTVSTNAKTSLNELIVKRPSGDIVLAQLNKPLNPTSGLTIGSIELNNFLLIGTNEYQASIVLGLKSKQNVQSVRPIEIRKIFGVDSSDPINAKRIVSCGGNSGAAGFGCRSLGSGQILKPKDRQGALAVFDDGPDLYVPPKYEFVTGYVGAFQRLKSPCAANEKLASCMGYLATANTLSSSGDSGAQHTTGSPPTFSMSDAIVLNGDCMVPQGAGALFTCCPN